jgi:hypothetical protein
MTVDRSEATMQASAPELRLDEIIAEEVLVSAEEVARQAGLPLAAERTPQGATAVRWEPHTRPALELRVRPDWGACDQLVIPIYLPEGEGGRLDVTIAMRTRTEGLEHNDRYWTGYPIGTAARRAWSGWRRLEFPIENFLIYGIPDAWHGVETLTLTLARAPYAEVGPPSYVLLGPILLQQRRRVQGQRLTDAGLFAELDLDRPGLEQVRAAVQAGDLQVAGARLCDYFRQRTEPKHFYGQLPEGPVDLAAADQICRHVILGQPLGPEINWRANPIGYLEWMHAFNRHRFLADLVHAYLATKDEKYATELDYLLSTWLRQNPHPVGNNGGGDPAWETLSTAVRIYGSWLDVFFGTLGSPSFRDSTRIEMLKSLYHHAEHLLEHSPLGANNWLVVESQVVATLGVLFPEFRRSRLWQEEGYRRLIAEIQRQVYPDGAHYELSAGYHCMSGQGFAGPYELAQLNGIPLPAVYAERLRGMFDYIWKLARPDGTCPSHNDSGGIRGRHHDFVRRGARLFNDPVMEWFGTQGRAGTPPAITSHGFLDAGQLIMRSGWSPQDRWLFFDVGPYGAGHQHEDALGFELYSDGTLFLCDPGIASYMLEDWTAHQRDTAAHNTIMLDGRPQNRRAAEMRAQHIRSVRKEIFWATGRVLDVGRGQYSSGYRGLDGRFMHRRTIVFIRPEYWLLIDEIDGEGTHLVESLFHFTPMRLQIDRAAGRARTYRQNKPNLELIPLTLEVPLEWEIVCGRHEPPVQGWIADQGENLPAPCLILRTQATLPLRLALALVPYAAGVSAGVEARSVPCSAGALAVELRHRHGARDVFCVRGPGEGELAFDRFRTDGWLAVVRRDANGRVIAAAAVGAQYLRHDERELARGAAPVDLLEVHLS